MKEKRSTPFKAFTEVMKIRKGSTKSMWMVSYFDGQRAVYRYYQQDPSDEQLEKLKLKAECMKDFTPEEMRRDKLDIQEVFFEDG